jgi:hypothetical protein
MTLIHSMQRYLPHRLLIRLRSIFRRRRRGLSGYQQELLLRAMREMA